MEVEDSLRVATGSFPDEHETSPHYHSKLDFVNNRITSALNEHHDLHLIASNRKKRVWKIPIYIDVTKIEIHSVSCNRPII
jgi:hypothetical protein